MNVRADNRAIELFKNRDNQMKNIKEHYSFSFKEEEIQVSCLFPNLRN